MVKIDLTRNQYNAVYSDAKRIACIAGPGTGKTRTLTIRIKRLLAEGIPASNFLVLTFTNKAAQEIRERLECPDILAGTFHAICYQLINQYIELFPEFFPFFPVIYDQEDQEDILKEVLEKSLSNLKPKEVQNILLRKYQDLEPLNSFTMQEVVFLSEFEDIVIREGHALTYDMILWLFWKRLTESVSFWQEMNNHFTYVFVDEYQDTNRIQAELIRKLMPEHLFVVGDLDQAIYAWRGARLTELIAFTEKEGTETIFLDTSFRSRPEILLAAHNLITHNNVGFKKMIYSVKEPGNGFQIKSFNDSNIQNAAIVLTGQLLLEGKFTATDTLGILTRTNREAAEIAQALKDKGIDHLLLTTEQELWSDFLIKNLLAYLKLVINPLNIHSLYRALRIPTREWYNPRTKTELHLNAMKIHKPVLEILREEHSEDMIFEFLKVITPETFITDAMTFLIEEILPNAVNILPNKLELIRLMRDRMAAWSHKTNDCRLKAFLQWVTFRDTQDKLLFENKNVLVMTIHGAKGLEFDRVIIPSVVEDNIPSKRGDLEEERRLLYVGITRAKEMTVLSYALQKIFTNAYGNMPIMKMVTTVPSRFIEETQEEKP